MDTHLVGRAAGVAVAAGLGVAVLAGHGCAQASAAPAFRDDTAASDRPTVRRHDATADVAAGRRAPRKPHTARDARRPDPVRDTSTVAPAPSRWKGAARSTAGSPDSRAVTAPTKAPARFTFAVRPPVPNADAPDADSAPQTPPDTPAQWTLLAAARREIDRAAPLRATPRPSVLTEHITTAAAQQPPDSVAPADPADLDTLYTGRPTFFTKIVTVGLQVVGTVLRPFGGLVNFTTIKVPVLADGVPPAFVTRGLEVGQSDFEGMTVWTLQPPGPSTAYVVALHGGAYAAEASIFHYLTYAALARETGATVVVPDYPLVSEGGTAAEVVPVTADLIAEFIAQHGAENVSVLGDSAGGGLAVAAVRTLVERDRETPARMVLLAPWLDVTMSDPLSAAIRDPLLTVRSLRKFGIAWAGDLDPTDPIVSPLFGSLDGLPPTTVFSGSQDMLAADALRLRDRVIAEGLTDVTFVLRKGLVHDWPIFPFLPEAQSIRPQIYSALLGSVEPRRDPAATP